MKQVICMGRGSGKSTRACRDVVEFCTGTGQAVAVFSEEHKKRLLAEAVRQGVQIPEPVVIKLNKKPQRGFTFAGVIVEDLWRD